MYAIRDIILTAKSKNDTDFIEALLDYVPSYATEEIEDMLLEEQMCPMCAGELMIQEFEENHGLDFPLVEIFRTMVCKSCGWE